jgi:HSP20 family protein
MKKSLSNRDWIENIIGEMESDFHPLWNESDKCLEPLIDVSTLENVIRIEVDLPCVLSKKDISLTVQEDSVEINAIMNHTVKWEKWGTFQKEIEFKAFKKVIRLPEKVEPKTAKAKFDQGILVVTLPRIQHKYDIRIE